MGKSQPSSGAQLLHPYPVTAAILSLPATSSLSHGTKNWECNECIELIDQQLVLCGTYNYKIVRL